MVKLSKQSEWKTWQAFALEILVCALLFTAGGFMQSHWGMVGLVTTEFMFLALAIGVAYFHKTPLKEVFPIKKIKLKEFFGVVILTVAGLMLGMMGLGISMILLPNSMAEIQGLSDFMYNDTSYLFLLFSAVLLPAICEESIQRGAILSHLRSIDNDIVIALIMGVFFGLFHLSPLRFLTTATLGTILSYVMIRKNNMVFPMLMHGINNFISVSIGTLSSKAGSTGDALANVNPIQILGSYCTLGFLAPILFVLAFRMIDKENYNKKNWLYAVIISAVIFAVGIGCTAIATVGSEQIFSQNGTFSFSAEKNATDAEVELEKDGTYLITCIGSVREGKIGVKITDENGKEVYNKSKEKTLFINEMIGLEAGKYTFYLYGDEDTYGKDTTFNITFMRQGKGKKSSKQTKN